MQYLHPVSEDLRPLAAKKRRIGYFVKGFSICAIATMSGGSRTLWPCCWRPEASLSSGKGPVSSSGCCSR